MEHAFGISTITGPFMRGGISPPSSNALYHRFGISSSPIAIIIGIRFRVFPHRKKALRDDDIPNLLASAVRGTVDDVPARGGNKMAMTPRNKSEEHIMGD